jgi:hypothetical protein
MKKLLILIVAIALYLHFYPQPELDRWFNEHKQTMLDTFNEATDTNVKLKADKIYSDLTPQLSEFSQEEIDYLKQITASRKSVASFFAKYCQSKIGSAKLHAANQAKICKTISRYQSLL